MRDSAVSDDLYGLLGVPADACLQEIKRAYRRRARELHPDAYGDRATEERFHRVTLAYETLRDPESRRRYDRRCREAEQAERRRRAEAAERLRREEARRREEERRRREEAARLLEERRRREEEHLRRQEEERRRRRSEAALAAMRRREQERIASASRRRALAPRVLLACAAACCALGVAGALLTLDGRARALALHRDGPTATATVGAFHEERLSSGGQPATGAVTRSMEVSFEDREGRSRSATLTQVRERHRPGERVEVVYDAGRVELSDACGQGESLACTRRSLTYLGLSALAVLAGVAFLVTSLSARRRLAG